jgi:hypothetical protein
MCKLWKPHFLYLNKMKRSFLGLTVIFLLSCNSPKSPALTDILQGDCFWDRTGDKQVIGGLNSCYMFSAGERCFSYYYNFYNHKRTDSVWRYDDGDVLVQDTWSVMGDTSLVIRGTQYKVLNAANDSVLVVEQPTNDTIVLRKNCKTFIGG